MKQKRYSEKAKTKAVELVRKGWRTKDVSKQLGMSSASVAIWVRKSGLKKKRSSNGPIPLRSPNLERENRVLRAKIKGMETTIQELCQL